jgi:transposase InsO family protein
VHFTFCYLLMIAQDTRVYFLRRKSDVLKYFKEFRTMVEKQIGKSIKILHSDQRGQYKLGDFIKYCKDHGIVQQIIDPTLHGKIELLKGKTKFW